MAWALEGLVQEYESILNSQQAIEKTLEEIAEKLIDALIKEGVIKA